MSKLTQTDFNKIVSFSDCDTRGHNVKVVRLNELIELF